LREKIGKLQSSLCATRARRVGGWVASGAFVLFIYFLVEMYNFRSVPLFFRFIWLHPKSALLGVLIVGAVYALFLLLSRRSWVAALCSGSLWQICGIVHFLKVALNGDPFVPMDFTMTSQMGELVRFINVSLPWWGWLLPVLLTLYILLLWLWQRNLPKGLLWYRLAGCIILPALLVGFVHPDHAPANFKVFGMTYMDAALQSSNYRANGFVSAYYLNIATMNVVRPADYSKETVETLLSDFEETPAERKPDVIVFLCESFWDVRNLPDTSFSQNPMYFYDQLCSRENAYSGTLYSTALGGGTVRTEFDVLTGLSTDYLPTGASPYIYAKENLLTHITLFKDEGYDTFALHPYDEKFYTRAPAYPYMGFDDFYGESDIVEMMGGEENIHRERGYMSDDTFVDAVIRQLESGKAPTFLFALSMENHQTYYPLEEYEIEVENKHLSEDLSGALSTYTQGVYHSNKALEKLIDYIDNRERETLLIFFGDHLPTLGANHAAYAATDYFDGSEEDQATRKRMYGTPFVIYGNFDLKENAMENTGNEMSDYYLLTKAAELSGTRRTPYMNWLLEQYESVPYLNYRLAVEESDKVAAFRDAHQIFTYDRLVGGRYSK